MLDSTQFSVVGVDLAAAPEKTGYCEIVVNPASGTTAMEIPEPGKCRASDEALLEKFSRKDVARIGIDAPFGWPTPFIHALHSWSRHDVWPRDRPRRKKRRERHFADLTLRATDVHVADKVDGVTPLSVSADKIAVVAMRAALLLSRAPASLDVDRSGKLGQFVEVYPAAAFARWNIETSREGAKPKSYKKNPWVCEQVAKDLFDRLPPVGQGGQQFPERDHNAVDALVSALVALMVEIDPERDKGFIEPIPAGMEAVARREGWIALPRKCSLTRLGLWLQGRQREAEATV